jgi:hypothetical protein
MFARARSRGARRVLSEVLLECYQKWVVLVLSDALPEEVKSGLLGAHAAAGPFSDVEGGEGRDKLAFLRVKALLG